MRRSKKTVRGLYNRRRALVIVLAVLIVLLLIAVAFEVTGVTDFFNPRRAEQYATTPASPTRTLNENTKGEQQTETEPEDQKDQEQPNSAELIDPTGVFVSNHRPGHGGDILQSTCNTTPGSMCEIVFTKGSIVKSLPPQQTDQGGSAYWFWSLQDLGLEEGSWKITAKATLGSQTKSTTDPIPLEVAL